MDCNNSYSIAIDGPAGSGKSTVAREVAKILDIEYIDTGAMYRALTFKLINDGVDLKDISTISKKIRGINIEFKNNSIYLNNKLLDKEIRKNYISQNVSYVAQIKEVRDMMLVWQRSMAKSKNIVMDGRDIGTVVLPNAEFKFFLTASIRERAERRYKELIHRGERDVKLKDIILEIENRDFTDSNRKIAPLKQAEDSHTIDTTDKTIKETVDYIVSIVLGGK